MNRRSSGIKKGESKRGRVSFAFSLPCVWLVKPFRQVWLVPPRVNQHSLAAPNCLPAPGACYDIAGLYSSFSRPIPTVIVTHMIASDKVTGYP